MSDGGLPAADPVLGMTICSNCQKRFRLSKQHEALVGKSVRCPACHQPFLVKLDTPSQLEQAALENAEQDQTQEAKQRRTRRTKSQIREEFLKQISDGLKSFHKRLAEIVEQQNSSEEQIRVWCIDVLKRVLGYEDSHIDTEVYSSGQRIDIALKVDGKIFLVIECKKPKTKLTKAVCGQAVTYAVNKSAHWAVATNGEIWKLWRVLPQRGEDPLAVPVFDVALLDEDGVSESDVASFYLLTSRALFNGETDDEFHRQYATDGKKLLRAVMSERVVSAFSKALVEAYLEETGEKITLPDDFVADRIEAEFIPAVL